MYALGERYDPSMDLVNESSHDHKNDAVANVLHIRVQKRTVRKAVTTVSFFATERKVEAERFVALVKTKLACGCSLKLVDDGYAVQIQGDHRAKIRVILIEHGFATPAGVKMHGG